MVSEICLFQYLENMQYSRWMRWLATVAGVIGGISSILGGIFLLIGNLLGGVAAICGAILMLVLGFFIFVFEATFVCRAVSFAQPIISRMDRVRFWHRGVLYCG